MPLNPSGLMALRNGPAMGPQPTAGTGMPGAGAPQDPSNAVTSAIANLVNQQRTADGNFTGKSLKQIMRALSVFNVHLQGQHPDVAADLNSAWAKIKAAVDKLEKSQSAQSVRIGGPVQFSGAGMAPTQNVAG